MKKFLKTRTGICILMMCLSIVLPGVLAGILWLISKRGFIKLWFILFFLFCAPAFLAAVFLLLQLYRNHEIGSACGVYYGGIFLYSIIHSSNSTFLSMVAGFCLAAVLCHLIIFKKDHKE